MPEELLERLTPRLVMQGTNWKKAQDSRFRLIVTLRHLVSEISPLPSPMGEEVIPIPDILKECGVLGGKHISSRSRNIPGPYITDTVNNGINKG